MTDEVTTDTTKTPDGQFDKPIAGRSIRFYNLTLGQSTLLQRYLSVHRTNNGKLGDLLQMLLEVAESRFVNADDLEFVNHQILAGKLEILDVLTPAIGFTLNTNTAADDADPTPAKRPRKKAAPKPAVKRTANPRRASK